jgi:hypothetical protein
MEAGGAGSHGPDDRHRPDADEHHAQQHEAGEHEDHHGDAHAAI